MAAAFYVLTAVLIFAIYVNGIWPSIVASQAQMSEDGVFVMYAASLIKTFEEKLGPTFQEKTGYIYEGEARGSVQVANMIIDGFRPEQCRSYKKTNEQWYSICKLVGQVRLC